MKKTLATTIVLSTVLVSTAFAQYGLMENYEGADRFANNTNLTDGINFTFGAASGGGEGAAVAINGTSGFGWGTGAALTDGFGIQIRDSSTNAGPDVIDLTQTVNGLTSTGYTISIRDVDSDGVGGVDEFQLVVEDDSVPPGQEIFDITGLALNADNTLTFNAGDGVAGPDGIADRTRFKQFVIRASSISGGGANINVDDIGFTGNLVPTSYDVEDFEAFGVGDLATGGRNASLNNFAGVTEAFSFGSNVTGATVVDLGGGDDALQMDFDGLQAGFLIELGPITGSQVDVSAQEGLTIDIATAEAGQEVEILIETIDAPTFGDRCSTIITPGTTVNTVQIPFSSLNCGAQGFSPEAVHRITILPTTADAGTAGSISITVDDIAFYGSSSVNDWMMH